MGPNPEQKLAIEHHGGVLLSAGAGSGKTFVLVEHIIYLLTDYFEKYDPERDFELQLREYLSSIVMMTFTKKAAGEMQIRLRKRIDKQVSLEVAEKWEVVRDNLSYLNVTTIHGFCYKLLKQGSFPNYGPGTGIISEIEASERVELLYNEWINSDFAADNSALVSMLTNDRFLIKALVEIFGDPSLRLMWRDTKISDLTNVDMRSFLTEYFEFIGVTSLFVDSLDLGSYDEHKKKKWFELASTIEGVLSNGIPDSLEKYENLVELFKGISRLMGPPAKSGLTEVIERFDLYKTLRSFVVQNEDNFINYFEYKDTIFKDWATEFKNVFDFIDKRSVEFSGLTFSDIEYLTYQGLQDEESVKRIGERYRYFIVDEFQDTSFIQFEMIQKMIQHDFSRLFCVGDEKQAIYGFRGGELAVFEQCKQAVAQNLTLTNNYRSRKEIIEFNNGLFSTIFPMAAEYQGEDRFSVEVVNQTVPDIEYPDTGGVYVNRLELDVESSLSTQECNLTEGASVTGEIAKLRNTHPDENICILYAKLKPSLDLISSLIQHDIGFTAQVKIPYGEDPILGLFGLLLECQLIEENSLNKRDDYFSLVLSSYLQYFKITVPEDLMVLFNGFIQDAKEIGLAAAYKKFIYDCNISNSNHSSNIAVLDHLILSANGDMERTYELLQNHQDTKYSFDFQYGDNPEKVIIMTSHASKGLEFDHVFLGGIHSNGREAPDRSLFGSMPGSFKWKASSSQKGWFTSPAFLLEKEIMKHKNFSESKRLFYVACTRAVKTLRWMDISANEKPFVYNKNSWVQGMRYFTDAQTNSNLFLEQEIDVNKIDTSAKSLKAPMFQMDSLGITSLPQHLSSLSVMSEISVTRLAALADCPRKFYLQSICKISEEEMEYFEDRATDVPNIIPGNTNLTSSSERGTLVHDAISKMIQHNWVIPRNVTEERDLVSINWIKEKLSLLADDFDPVSEKGIKFPIMNYMISGTPDLLMIPKENTKVLEVWDFKTGARNSDKEQSYWFQLSCYALASYELGYCAKNSDIKLVLAYVDDEDMVERIVRYEELKHDIFSLLKLNDKGFVSNDEHCSRCLYRNICH